MSVSTLETSIAGESPYFFDKKPLTISTLIASLHGITQPKLVLCSDGRLHVLKMHKNPSGPNALANEFISSTLLRGLGFYSPRASFISIDQRTLDCHPNLILKSYEGGNPARRAKYHRPRLGLHFGSEYIETFTRHGERPGSSRSPEFLGIGIFDVWAAQSDTRQYIKWWNPQARRLMKSYIDNASLFGGPEWDKGRLEDRTIDNLHVNLGEKSGYEAQIAFWIDHLQSRIPKLLEGGLAHLPNAWYQGDLSQLEDHLLRRLANLPRLVHRAMVPNTHRHWMTLLARDCSCSAIADD